MPALFKYVLEEGAVNIDPKDPVSKPEFEIKMGVIKNFLKITVSQTKARITSHD